MSTKSTIFLTKDNEHWYHDCNARYYEETITEDAIVLEFNPKHRVEIEKDGSFRVVIQSNTELYNSVCNLNNERGTKKAIRITSGTDEN